jgi:hypothetical protein
MSENTINFALAIIPFNSYYYEGLLLCNPSTNPDQYCKTACFILKYIYIYKKKKILSSGNLQVAITKEGLKIVNL